MFPPSRRVVIGGVSPLNYSDAFTQANGALGNGWEYSTGVWTVASNAAVGTPALGAELVTNGNFAAWTADNPDSWTVAGESGTDPEITQRGTGQGHADGPAGTGFCNLYTSSAIVSITQTILTAGKWYATGVNINTRVAGTLTNGGFLIGGAFTSTGAKAYRALANATGLNYSRNGATDVTFDDSTCKLITNADLFATKNFKKKNVDVSVAVTCGTDEGAGLVLGLDSTSNPLYYLIANVNRITGGSNRVFLSKWINGTYTGLINATITYSADAALRVVKNGVSVSVYYNGTQVGTTQTLTAGTDDILINGTRHGMFSNSANNSLDSFSIVAA